MPKTGTSESNRPGSSRGAPGSYTLDGPPERITASGLRASISAAGMECGTISEYTSASRTRRAMSCAYCAPKSTTRTGLGVLIGQSYVGWIRGRDPGRYGGVDGQDPARLRLVPAERR